MQTRIQNANNKVRAALQTAREQGFAVAKSDWNKLQYRTALTRTERTALPTAAELTKVNQIVNSVKGNIDEDA